MKLLQLTELARHFVRASGKKLVLPLRSCSWNYYVDRRTTSKHLHGFYSYLNISTGGKHKFKTARSRQREPQQSINFSQVQVTLLRKTFRYLQLFLRQIAPRKERNSLSLLLSVLFVHMLLICIREKFFCHHTKSS